MDAGLDPSRDTGFWDQLLFNNAFEPSENGPEPLLSSTVHSSNNFGSSGRHPFYPTVPTPPSHESSYSRQQSRMFPSLNTTHHATHSSAPNTSTQPLASFDLPDFPLPQNNIQPPPSQDLAFGPEYQGSDFQLPNLDTLVQELEPTDRSDPWSSSIDRLFEDSWTDPHTSGDFIDLTTDSSPPTMPVITRKRKPSEQTSSESSSILLNTAKRKRTGNLHLKNENTAVEEVDLREVDDDQGLSKILHDQQAATIKAQQQQESETPLTLSTVQCVVCMDSMTDMTVTHCGHLFCHTCIMEALIAGEHQGDQGKGQSRCPVCRKKVSRPRDDKTRAKDRRELIPLEIKFLTRSSMAKGKGKALVAD